MKIKPIIRPSEPDSEVKLPYSIAWTVFFINVIGILGFIIYKIFQFSNEQLKMFCSVMLAVIWIFIFGWSFMRVVIDGE
jgi:hypothetical protein